jgi:hypothetical protein
MIARLLVASAVVTGVTAADPPYVGKWKLNAAKSTMSGDTVTIENVAGGMMQFNSQGYTYKFKLDGREYPMPDGGTTAWTAANPQTWDVTNRMGGKVSSTYHLALQGDQLAVSGKSMKPDGGSVDFTATYKRVSGGPGFAGRWMSTQVQMPASLLEIAANGTDGVTLKDETGFVASGKFDGKDNPATGKMAGSKYTFAFKQLNPSSFEVTTKLDGKPMYVEVYTVSADGKTLTDNGTPTGAPTEKFKIVYDRQ